MSHDHHYQNPVEAPHVHVLPLWLYLGVFGALLGLTLLTVFTAQFDLGDFDIFVAMGIATAKATLVGVIFMHLWWDEKINTVIIFIALALISVFFVFSIIDVTAHGLVDPVSENFKVQEDIIRKYKEKDPNGPLPRAWKDGWYRPPTAEEQKELIDFDAHHGGHAETEHHEDEHKKEEAQH